MYDNYNFINTQAKECVMKRTIALLAMALVMLLVLASTVPAVHTPRGGDPIGPVDDGSEGEDGDHPWGGDRVIGDGDGGSSSVRTARTSVLTGYLIIDVLITDVFYYLAPQENKRDDLIGRQNTSVRFRYRFSLSREAQK
jgi:hypothetical protein